jgi:hypothetical protein
MTDKCEMTDVRELDPVESAGVEGGFCIPREPPIPLPEGLIPVAPAPHPCFPSGPRPIPPFPPGGPSPC